MLEILRKSIFSFVGVSIFLGVAGFVSAVVGLFIDTQSLISIKWAIFLLLVFSSIIIILLKMISDLIRQKPLSSFENPIRILPDDILVIRKNNNFVSRSLVGCYFIEDDIERPAYIGTVLHVQENLIQIKLVEGIGDFKNKSLDPKILKSLIVRSAIPESVLNSLLQGA